MPHPFSAAKPLGFAAILLSLAGCANIAQKNGGATAPIVPLKPFAIDVATQRAHEVRLQLFLDKHEFRPGVVDGRAGEFFAKALRQYNQANGIPESTLPDVSDVTPYTTYTITADDLSRIGTMATDNADIAKQKSCPYTSLSSLVAERFHTTRAFLSALNPGQEVDQLQAGDAIQVPNVAHPFRIDHLPAISKTPRNPHRARRKISIDVSTRMLEVWDKDKVIASFPITPGSSEHPAPIGDWEITGIATFPWFRYDEGVLERGERTEVFFNFPPGPRSPVGILWMQLNRPGVGIHGSPNPETIGRAGSHGCIRLANWDAALIRTLVTTGTPVNIH